MNVFNNILVIGKVWPEPKSSAAGTRMMQLLHYFIEKGTHLTFASTANPSQFQVDLDALDINVAQIKLNSNTFDEFVKDLNPTLVVFDRFMTEEQFGWRVMEQCPEALRVLNTEDMHFLRDARKHAVKEGKSIDLNNQSDLSTDAACREISAIYRSDLSLIISEVEVEMLKNTFQIPDHLLHYLPLFAPDPLLTIPSYEERSDFIFIGNFLHEPNWDAVRYLSEEIWPLIRMKMPKAVLNIYGAYPTQKAMELNKPINGFHVHGRADDAIEVTKKARVSLAPIRFGAGIKGKLIEAMVCGTPTVTTSIGAEAMQHTNLWNGTIVDDPQSIADAAVELYSNIDQWSQAQKNGFVILENRFKLEQHLPKLNELFDTVFSNIKEHRAKDFTSKLMQQQTMMSSRYLSYWIMEKEKK
jgi:glycosyltransferase involved in cell wall biosynthesis